MDSLSQQGHPDQPPGGQEEGQGPNNNYVKDLGNNNPLPANLDNYFMNNNKPKLAGLRSNPPPPLNTLRIKFDLA